MRWTSILVRQRIVGDVVCCSEERDDSQGKALNLLVNLSSPMVLSSG